MKITNVTLERTFNLGNYESLKVGFEAVLSEADKPLEVTRDLEMLAHQHYENRNAAKPPQVPQPSKTESSQLEKPVAKGKDGNVCPKCGGAKKPGYEVCWTCHEKGKT